MFLTTPHAEGPVALHAFPSGEMTATCEVSELGADIDDRFDFVAAFLDDRTVIAPLVESARHVVLHADGLRPKGFISYLAKGGSGYPLSPHDGTWVTLDGNTLTRWRLS
jgi:hypothetical protein